MTARCPVHGIPDCSPLLNGCSWQPPSLPEKRCPKARRSSVPHTPHEWFAGRYLPVGDIGYLAWCPGPNAETTEGRL